MRHFEITRRLSGRRMLSDGILSSVAHRRKMQMEYIDEYTQIHKVRANS